MISYLLLGFFLASIVVYAITMAGVKEIVKQNILVAAISSIISFILVIGNLVLSTTEYAYLSSGFTSALVSIIPALAVKYVYATKLDMKIKKLNLIVREKKELLPMVTGILYGLIEDRPECRYIFSSAFRLVKVKYRNREISKEQYRELRSLKALT